MSKRINISATKQQRMPQSHLVGNIQRMVRSAWVLHIAWTALVFGDLLDIFVVADGILALGHHATTLLDTVGMNWITMVELLEFFRFVFDAFAVTARDGRSVAVVVDLNVAAFHFDDRRIKPKHDW